MKCFVTFFLLIWSVTIAGCGPAAVVLPDTVPFSGVVTLDGQPLAGAAILFINTDQKAGLDAFGTTDEKGAYSLSIGTGEQVKSGAVAGSYTVRISRMLSPDGKPVDRTKPAVIPGLESVPVRYMDPKDKDFLKAKIEASGGTKNFDLKSSGTQLRKPK